MVGRDKRLMDKFEFDSNKSTSVYETCNGIWDIINRQ
jgi:hypothetical protein